MLMNLSNDTNKSVKWFSCSSRPCDAIIIITMIIIIEAAELIIF